MEKVRPLIAILDQLREHCRIYEEHLAKKPDPAECVGEAEAKRPLYEKAYYQWQEDSFSHISALTDSTHLLERALLNDAEKGEVAAVLAELEEEYAQVPIIMTQIQTILNAIDWVASSPVPVVQGSSSD